MCTVLLPLAGYDSIDTLLRVVCILVGFPHGSTIRNHPIGTRIFVTALESLTHLYADKARLTNSNQIAIWGNALNRRVNNNDNNNKNFLLSVNTKKSKAHTEG